MPAIGIVRNVIKIFTQYACVVMLSCATTQHISQMAETARIVKTAITNSTVAAQTATARYSWTTPAGTATVRFTVNSAIIGCLQNAPAVEQKFGVRMPSI
jgi:hypothetical protein